MRALKGEWLRNQVMLLLAYDGALRREELVRLEIAGFDFAYRQIRVRAEHAKKGSERVVGYIDARPETYHQTLRAILLEMYRRGTTF